MPIPPFIFLTDRAHDRASYGLADSTSFAADLSLANPLPRPSS
jgi:hypothetical protein